MVKIVKPEPMTKHEKWRGPRVQVNVLVVPDFTKNSVSRRWPLHLKNNALQKTHNS